MHSEADITQLPLKICVLNGDYSQSSIKLDFDPACNPQKFLPDTLPWQWEMAFLGKATFRAQLRQLKKKNFDLYWNFCDGFPDADVAGDEVRKALEDFNLPYVGCDGRFVALKKKSMKALATLYGINTPRYAFVYDESEIEIALKQVKTFPMIVKHHNSGGSEGLTSSSKVKNEQELREQVKIMIENFDGALVEEFIEGTEYAVVLVEDHQNPNEPIILDPQEWIFPEGESFKHEQLKFVDFEKLGSKAVTDLELKENLKKLARDSYVRMFANHLARVDIRASKEGKIYFLEINCLPQIFNQGCATDEIVMKSKEFTMETLIYHFVKLAFKNYERKQEPIFVGFKDLQGNLGVFAKRDLKKDEVVLTDEGKTRIIVSKRYAEEKRRGEISEDLFKRFAIPIGDGIYSTWKDDVETWRPIAHSCEPTAWFKFHEQTIIMRDDVKKGEEITLDYSTFLSEGDFDISFDCNCGHSNCRKKITPQDWKKKELVQKYQGHYSVYLENKVEQLL